MPHVTSPIWGAPLADPGEGPGGARTPLFFDQNEARRAKKSFLETGHSSYLRVEMTAPPPPPPYLKVWIRHCAPVPCKQALTFERQHTREAICKAARNEGGSPREEKIVVFSFTAPGS